MPHLTTSSLSLPSAFLLSIINNSHHIRTRTLSLCSKRCHYNTVTPSQLLTSISPSFTPSSLSTLSTYPSLRHYPTQYHQQCTYNTHSKNPKPHSRMRVRTRKHAPTHTPAIQHQHHHDTQLQTQQATHEADELMNDNDMGKEDEDEDNIDDEYDYEYDDDANANETLDINDAAGAKKYSPPFSHLPTIATSPHELWNSAMNKSHKVSVKQRATSPTKYIQRLLLKRLFTIHHILCLKMKRFLDLFPFTPTLHAFDRSLVQLSLSSTALQHKRVAHNSSSVWNYMTTKNDDGSSTTSIQYNGELHYNAILKNGQKFVRELEELYVRSQESLYKCQSRRQLKEQWFNTLERYRVVWFGAESNTVNGVSSSTSKQSNQLHASHVLEQLYLLRTVLYRLPVINPTLPTVALIGCPNVGKSSIVRMISTGKPEVQNYSFTTRGIVCGHMKVNANLDTVPVHEDHRDSTQAAHHTNEYDNHLADDLIPSNNNRMKQILIQITDTPGLLARSDANRKSIELLTLSILQHLTLPPIVLYVIDMTEHCGYSIETQLLIRYEIQIRFPHIKIIDVYSKSDLIDLSRRYYKRRMELKNDADMSYIKQYMNEANSTMNGTHTDSDDINWPELSLPSNGIHVSTLNNSGADELVDSILSALTHDAAANYDQHMQHFKLHAEKGDSGAYA